MRRHPRCRVQVAQHRGASVVVCRPAAAMDVERCIFRMHERLLEGAVYDDGGAAVRAVSVCKGVRACTLVCGAALLCLSLALHRVTLVDGPGCLSSAIDYGPAVCNASVAGDRRLAYELHDGANDSDVYSDDDGAAEQPNIEVWLIQLPPPYAAGVVTMDGGRVRIQADYVYAVSEEVAMMGLDILCRYTDVTV